MKPALIKNIFLIDDHQMVIDGLKLMLADLPKFKVVGESKNPLLVIDLLQDKAVDILITDISMPQMSGVALSRLVKKNYPDIKILALTAFAESAIISEMIQAGIAGYILKSDGKLVLTEALETIVLGEQYFGNEVTLALANSYRQHKDDVKLTDREIEIIRLIEKDMSTKEIAETLFISERTVETHRKNILFKTDTHTVIGLIKYAYERKII
jgi:DNA-binding NarL/FixJ family response regulator